MKTAQAKGKLNCDENPRDYPGEGLDCVPLYTLLIGCSDRLSYCFPWAPSVPQKSHTTPSVLILFITEIQLFTIY